MEVWVASLISFLFGGGSVALFTFVKFNGRLIKLETRVADHIAEVNKRLKRIEEKLQV